MYCENGNYDILLKVHFTYIEYGSKYCQEEYII